MKRNAFTLVELLIVVVILGILAAVVIPQFTDASTDARLSSLTTNLATIRGQIELYKLQHGGSYPNLTTPVTFVDAMTKKTDATGAVSASGKYGPYLQAIPNNPFTVPPANDVTNTAAAVTKAWNYDETTGAFIANDGGATNGTAHSAL